jgi:hypothetical protein
MRNLILFFICLFSIFTLSAQQPSARPIYELTYIKATPGKSAEFLQCETQVWAKIHAQLKESRKYPRLVALAGDEPRRIRKRL